ncbi:YheC/YheD family endospore coat-associated protein [Paenibacillus mendelii]|uniref:YheC/YheD family protein n=1 Tax=Paenibacillus mendelii TaxID=206163 RepID=A0ABV6J9Z0_9BACL|nr:YheC/YheD family protein [Paenibacillus mendelii]MCQ6559700.1 YheC/YheD family protein [Paenibacillus mendelii]
MDRRYVGILLNKSVFEGIPSGNTKHEAIRFYEEAGHLHGLTPCYFRLQDIRLHQHTVNAYVKNHSGYIRTQLSIPAVIHNRALFTHTGPKKQIKKLVQSGIQVFNGWNRYGKLHIHNLLMENISLRPHIPGTVAATPDALKDMMALYDSLILKPNSSSIGRGIMRLDRSPAEWQLTYRTRDGWRKHRFVSQIPLFLKRKLQRDQYIVQQRLPLATYNGCPFDLRVSIQRTHTGDWAMTGIAAKVAAKNAFITNVAQGGTVYRLEEILRQYPELNAAQVRNNIEDFCLHAARHLSGYLPHLADVGFDIGLTSSGYPLFVECNGRDLRYSFQKGNMPQEWRATYTNPIGFARYLLDGKVPPNRGL